LKVQIESDTKKQINHRFGSAVKHFRHLLGVSQEGLAELAGLDRTYIGHVERGARNVSLSTIDRLARALKVSTVTLLSKLGEPGREGANSAACSVQFLLVESGRREAQLTRRAFKRAHIANPIHVLSESAEVVDFLIGKGKYSNRSTSEQPALVLVGLGLAGQNGIEVLRRLKSDPRTKQVPVIVLARSRNDQDLQEALRLGAAAYIVKPVGIKGLTEVTPKLNLSWQLIGSPLEVKGRG
jgi:two-component system response regulator